MNKAQGREEYINKKIFAMRLKRLYRLDEYIKKLDTENVHQKQIILTGKSNDLYEMMYSTLRHFPTNEVETRIENENLTIRYSSYLTERMRKFIDKQSSGQFEILNEKDK